MRLRDLGENERAMRIRAAIRRRMRIKPLRAIVSPADVLTLGNGLSGFLAIAIVTNVAQLYTPPLLPLTRIGDDRFLVAAVLITVGLCCDALDGIVARRFGGSQLGGDLDTLSDAVTFVTTPALMVYIYYGTSQPFRALAAAGVFFMMGVLRLARFNSNPAESETKTFQGLPTPWAAITVVLMILSGLAAKIALPIVVIVGFLMMSNVAYPKSRDKIKYAAFLFIVAAMVAIIALLEFPGDQPRIINAAFVLVALTVAVSPFLLAKRRSRRLPLSLRHARKQPPS